MSDTSSKALGFLHQKVSEINERTSVRMYILKKTSSKNNERLYKIYDIDILGDIPKEFRQIIISKVNSVMSETRSQDKLRNFYDITTSQYYYSTLNESDVPYFKTFKETIKAESELPTFSNLREIKNFDAYAIKYELDGDEIIYLRNVTESRLITKKFGLTFVLYKGKFNKVKDDIIVFDKEVDCIYLRSRGIFFVLNKPNTEKIFQFSLYYSNQTKDVFDSLQSLVDIEDDFVESISQKISYARKITNLNKGNKFNKPISFFHKCDLHFKSHNKYPPNKIRIEIKNDKLQIRNEDDLKIFLRICNEDYVESIISNNPYVARSKDPIARSTS